MKSNEYIYIIVSYDKYRDNAKEHIIGAFTNEEDAQIQIDLDNNWAIKNSEVMFSKIIKVKLNEQWT